MGCFLPKFCNGVFSANLVLNGRALPSQRNKEEDREVVSGAGVVPVGAGQGMRPTVDHDVDAPIGVSQCVGANMDQEGIVAGGTLALAIQRRSPKISGPVQMSEIPQSDTKLG